MFLASPARAGRILRKALVLSGVVLIISALPASAREIFVAPTGSGSACIETAPCQLPAEINRTFISPGDSIEVMPGTYAAGAPMSGPGWSQESEVRVSVPNITIEGTERRNLPELTAADPEANGLYFLVSGSATSVVVRKLRVAGSVVAIGRGALLENLRVANGNGPVAAVFLGANTTLRDSSAFSRFTRAVEIISDLAGDGSRAEERGDSTVNLRNVTAVSRGDTAVFVARFYPYGGGQKRVVVVNSIARSAPGREVDIYPGLPQDVEISYSNFRPFAHETAARLIDRGHNQSVDPRFVNVENGDLRQRRDSPTVDAGADGPLNGSHDFEGDLRGLGSANDIGADELVSFESVAPTVTATVPFGTTTTPPTVTSPTTTVTTATPSTTTTAITATTTTTATTPTVTIKAPELYYLPREFEDPRPWPYLDLNDKWSFEKADDVKK